MDESTNSEVGLTEKVKSFPLNHFSVKDFFSQKKKVQDEWKWGLEDWSREGSS